MTVGLWGKGQSDFQLMLHSLAKVGRSLERAMQRVIAPLSPSLLQLNQAQRAIKSPLFEIALVLVRLDHSAGFIDQLM
jgi:hypothetical protein